MIDETTVTAPRISTDIQVDPVQIDTPLQDISRELNELEQQVKEIEQRRQNLIGRSQQGLSRFAPPSLFSTSDPDFLGGSRYNINDLNALLEPRLDRIEVLKKLQKTEMENAGIKPAPITDNITQEQLNDLNTGRTTLGGLGTSRTIKRLKYNKNRHTRRCYN